MSEESQNPIDQALAHINDNDALEAAEAVYSSTHDRITVYLEPPKGFIDPTDTDQLRDFGFEFTSAYSPTEGNPTVAVLFERER